jgi:hypothetical protein
MITAVDRLIEKASGAGDLPTLLRVIMENRIWPWALAGDE